MELLRVDSEAPDPQVMLAAAEAVLRGGVIAFPTDTLYGLGCSLFDVSAVAMVAQFWPGPLSLIFRAAAIVPNGVRGAGGTVALRCPKDTLCHTLLDFI